MKKNYMYFLCSIRMSEKSVKFGDIKVNKSTFYNEKKLFKMEDIGINKILVSKKEPYGKEKN